MACLGRKGNASIEANRLEANRGICRAHPYIECMANWQKSSTREPSKTKAELREMLTEAVRNTQPRPDHGPGVNEGEAG